METAMLVLAALLTAQPPPAPPSAPLRTYVQASVSAARMVGQQRYHRVSPPLSGWARELSFSAGRWLTPRIAVEGEIALSQRSQAQGFHYNWKVDYTLEHQDVMVGALVRARPGLGPVELVGGGGFAIASTAERDGIETVSLPLPRPSVPIADIEKRETALTASAGVDAAIRAGRHLVVVPSFRLRWIERPEASMAWYDGVGSFVWTFGVGLRGIF